MKRELPQKPNRVKAAIGAKLTTSMAARSLGVTREHLSRVLHGHRQSRRLLARHAELLRQHQHQFPQPLTHNHPINNP